MSSILAGPGSKASHRSLGCQLLFGLRGCHSRSERIREAVNKIFRSCHFDELNDPNLGALKRMIRQEVNDFKTLDKNMPIDWSALIRETLGNFTLTAFPPHVNLPALPVAVTKIVERSTDSKAELEDLAAIIETDTGLTLELLKHVNSASAGLRLQAGSVRRALVALGPARSRDLMLAVGTKAAVQARASRLINQTCFWNAALQKALFAQELAKLLKTDAEVAFTGALLQDFLLPVLTNELCERYMEFIERRDLQPINICDFERAEFGWDHALAGACLACAWNLPGELVCCILFHHAGLSILDHAALRRTSVAAVALAGLLPDQLRQCYHGLEQLILLERKWPAFNLQVVAETVDARQIRSGLGIPNDFPLARRCRSVLSQFVHSDGSTACEGFPKSKAVPDTL